MSDNILCSSINHNIIPINLDRDVMSNASPQLSDFVYDFKACSSFEISNGYPTWMDNGKPTGAVGCIKIKQMNEDSDGELLKFTTIGDLRGVSNKINIFYFPESLNLYDGNSPDGGEILIELQQKPSQFSNSSSSAPKDLERLLLFIPVKKGNEETPSSKWFQRIRPRQAFTNEPIIRETTSLSLNDIIPKSPFWVYNDISIHGMDCDETSSNDQFSKMSAIFFLDGLITIRETDYEVFNEINMPSIKKVNQIKENCNTPEDPSYWCQAWYPSQSAAANNVAKMGGDPTDEESKEQAMESDTAGNLNIQDIIRTTTKVNKGAIFLNEVGTKRGPGEHNDIGDPFSLTCEPIIDADDEKPLDGNRTEWVKGVYNAVPKGFKNTFWLLIFIVVLTGILVSIHVFIFKNIGLFITQNEIAGRATNT